MATKNDVTGDAIRSKLPSKAYSDNWDRIFKKKKKQSKPANNKVKSKSD
jgi:hypothetical protein